MVSIPLDFLAYTEDVLGQKTTLQLHTFLASVEARIPLLSMVLFLLTRLMSFRTQPTYFDSFEYLDWLEKARFSNWHDTLLQTHQPIHSFYLGAAFLLKIILPSLSSGEVFLILSITPGLLVVLIWPKVLHILKVPHNIANWAGLVLVFFPLFFLATTAVVYEPLLLLFQVCSLGFWARACQTNRTSQALTAGGFFGLATNIFVGNLILLPAFLVYWFSQSRTLKQLLSFLVPALVFPFILDIHLFGSLALVWEKYAGHSGDVPLPQGNLLLWCARVARNLLVGLISQVGWMGLIVAGLGTLRFHSLSFPRSTKIFLWTLFFCGLIYTQYWHAGLFGRLSLVLILPLSVAISFVANTKRLNGLLVLVLLTPNLYHLVGRMRLPLPAEDRLAQLQKTCTPESCSVVTTAPQSFWYEHAGYTTFGFRVGEPELPAAHSFIEHELQSGKIVLIDWLAQRAPYYQFDGPVWHMLSLGKTRTSVTKPLWETWHITLIGEGIHSPSMFSQVIGRRHTAEPLEVIPAFAEPRTYLERHLLGYDPLLQAAWLFQTKVITNWHYALPQERGQYSATMR